MGNEMGNVSRWTFFNGHWRGSFSRSVSLVCKINLVIKNTMPEFSLRKRETACQIKNLE